MQTAVHADQLTQVLADHPWLVELLTGEALWWTLEDGGVRFSLTVDDLEGRRDGLEALAQALGCTVVNTAPSPVLNDPPVRFKDLPRPSGRGEAS